MVDAKRYPKDLEHLTTIRLSKSMREEAEKKAEYLGISFSDFVRQALSRNIYITSGIEEEVNRKLLDKLITHSVC